MQMQTYKLEQNCQQTQSRRCEAYKEIMPTEP